VSESEWSFWLGYSIGGALCLAIVRTAMAVVTMWWRGGRVRYLLVDGVALALTWWRIWGEPVSWREKEGPLIGSGICILAWTVWNLSRKPRRPAAGVDLAAFE
jgi:hypothetical protein